MSRPWIMIKDIKGVEYAYLYKTVKEDGAFKSKMIRYLGRLDLLTEALKSVLKRRGKVASETPERSKTV